MSTHTKIGNFKWTHVLTIGLEKEFNLTPEHTSLDVTENAKYVMWTGYGKSDNVTIHGTWSSSNPMRIPKCLYSDFQLWHAAPEWYDRAFLGETNKWVPVSEARVSKVTYGKDFIEVDIMGENREEVELAFSHGQKVTVLKTTIPSSGTA